MTPRLLRCWTTTSRRNNYGIALAVNALENEEEAVITNNDEAMLLFDGNEPVTGEEGQYLTRQIGLNMMTPRQSF